MLLKHILVDIIPLSITDMQMLLVKFGLEKEKPLGVIKTRGSITGI